MAARHLLLLLVLLPEAPATDLCAAAGKRGEAAMCAPAPHRCIRPHAVFWLYIRQCAGFSVGKGVLDALSTPGASSAANIK